LALFEDREEIKEAKKEVFAFAAPIASVMGNERS
jgi:hypothetical protein